MARLHHQVSLRRSRGSKLLLLPVDEDLEVQYRARCHLRAVN
jgi:hypothetical protein